MDVQTSAGWKGYQRPSFKTLISLSVVLRFTKLNPGSDWKQRLLAKLVKLPALPAWSQTPAYWSGVQLDRLMVPSNWDCKIGRKCWKPSSMTGALQIGHGINYSWNLRTMRSKGPLTASLQAHQLPSCCWIVRHLKKLTQQSLLSGTMKAAKIYDLVSFAF